MLNLDSLSWEASLQVKMLYTKRDPKQVMREQRQRQDKLLKAAEEMGTYSSDKLFNKWHNERLLQTVISKNTFREVPNERYFSVSNHIHAKR